MLQFHVWLYCVFFTAYECYYPNLIRFPRITTSYNLNNLNNFYINSITKIISNFFIIEMKFLLSDLCMIKYLNDTLFICWSCIKNKPDKKILRLLPISSITSSSPCRLSFNFVSILLSGLCDPQTLSWPKIKSELSSSRNITSNSNRVHMEHRDIILLIP